MAEGKGGLAAKLARIDELLKTVNAEAAKSLAKPATAAKLAKLAKVVPVPDDVLALFRWHDGQKKQVNLHPEDNRCLLSVDDALDAWKFLGDPEEEICQPWSKTWLPLLGNGAGDYVCVETAKKGAGTLVTYYHDNKS